MIVGIPTGKGPISTVIPAETEKPGVVYLVINNSLTNTTFVELPKAALRYTLSAETMRSSVVLLNGKALSVSGICNLPNLVPEEQKAGIVSLVPGSCTFFVL